MEAPAPIPECDAAATLPCGARVMHGPFSSRVYVTALSPPAAEGGGADDAAAAQLRACQAMAEERGYGKVVAKLRVTMSESVAADAAAWPPSRRGTTPAISDAAVPKTLAALGFTVEAAIPCFYGPAAHAAFLGWYRDPRRKATADAEVPVLRALTESVVASAASAASPLLAATPQATSPTFLPIRKCGVEDVEAVVATYRAVFAAYPCPVFDPAYIRETMVDDAVEYFCIKTRAVHCDADDDAAQSGPTTIAALASSEKDAATRTAEMTDFATVPAFQGRGLAAALLAHMEGAMRAQRYRVLFSIARIATRDEGKGSSRSGGGGGEDAAGDATRWQPLGVSKVFARAGYAYGGTLGRNTHIGGVPAPPPPPGQVESMNIWWKLLPDAASPP